MGEKQESILHSVTKSKFVRSVFLQITLIFSLVIVAIIAIAFISFNSEINRNIIKQRRMQLEAVESTISRRMEEVSSVAYHIGNDSSFYFGDMEDQKYSGYELAATLRRYLVGNDFIEHLAYYRVVEPDTIYTASGELGFHDFWNSYMKIDNATADEYIKSIRESKEIVMMKISTGDESENFFSYDCPLPQFSKNPQAFVLMLISFEEVDPLMEAQLKDCAGQVLIYSQDKKVLYSRSTLKDEVNIDIENLKDESYVYCNGVKYVVLKTVSESNGWTYVSVYRMKDIVSGAANQQVLFIGLMLLLMIVAISMMFLSIAVKYKPINSLALKVTGAGEDGASSIIDEESVLSDTLAVLKDDSDQKKIFEAAYIEANAANRAKSTFLSNMSHDIRTPMNAIVGMTEIASKNIDDKECVQDCLQNVQAASRYLLDIINNVLDMSRIESGKFQLSDDVVELPKLVNGLVTILSHNLEVKSQTLSIEVEDIRNEKVRGDNVRLSQIFMNIVSNSIKFTPNGGKISLKLSQTDTTEEGYGNYVFEFADNGIGMSQEFIDRVFDTFTRDEKTDVSKIEGTGLGMAIAKSFVELMGGSIQCESKMNEGTRFTVKMSMKLEGEDVTVKDNTKYADRNILILGKELSVCRNQAKLFSEHGAKTDCVSSVQDALQRMDEGKKYHYVIINQSTEDKNGVLSLKEMLKRLPIPDTDYVFAASDVLTIERSVAFDAGIHMFVSTPLFRSTVRDILENTLDYKTAKPVDVINLADKRILLVEDNKINRQIAYVMLKETKAAVEEAVNGREAVELFKSHEAGYYDLILMDVQMPIMNGYEATQAIRSIQRVDALTIPIYAMTANTFDEDVRQVKEVGMDGHLGKPYVSEELFELLRLAFEKIKK